LGLGTLEEIKLLWTKKIQAPA